MSAPAGGRPPDASAPVAPELFVRDVDASIRFYVGALGFRVARTDPPGDAPHGFAVLTLGAAMFMLADEKLAAPDTRGRSDERRGRGIHVRVMVPDVDALHQRALAHGVRIVMPIGDRSYGLRDFVVEDPDGFALRFAAPLR